MNLHDYIEEYGEDPRDLDPPENAECHDCGHRFYVHVAKAARTDPAYLVGPEECPNCISENWHFL